SGRDRRQIRPSRSFHWRWRGRRRSRAVHRARVRRCDRRNRERGGMTASRTPVTETAGPPPRKALNPFVKFALELGPLALFFIVYSRVGIFAATGILMASVLVTLGVSYVMLKRIPIMPLVTAVIVLIFGSLTLILHDETLIKI